MRPDQTVSKAIAKNFLGHSPGWYKLTIVVFLLINPVLFQISGTVAGWVLILEFIFTLAMALRCYPLQPGGSLALEAVAIGMMVATRLSEIRGLCDGGMSNRLAELLSVFELPLGVPAELDAKQILMTMKLDKKVLGGQARLVLLESAGNGLIDTGSEARQMIEAIEASRA